MYQCLMAKEAYRKAEIYLAKLVQGAECGAHLKKKLHEYELTSLDVEGFLELLVNTKKPQIFAESAIIGNGLDWNLDELSILGDIGIVVPVKIFDNGQHRMPEVHINPFKGHLLYIPGALLNSCGEKPADWDEVVATGKVDLSSYKKLYRRRLLPLFKYADEISRKKDKKAFITIPGLGCGQFAGLFRGQLGEYLRKAIYSILEEFALELTNIRAVYYDPYMECENSRSEIGEISFLVRPLTRGNKGKSQLSNLCAFNENNDDFSKCEFFSVVAWDHVSWPGNDFFSNSRVTDDGVKAAATNSMAVITGVKGSYNSNKFKYIHPDEYGCWGDVVYRNDLELEIVKNLIVY